MATLVTLVTNRGERGYPYPTILLDTRSLSQSRFCFEPGCQGWGVKAGVSSLDAKAGAQPLVRVGLARCKQVPDNPLMYRGSVRIALRGKTREQEANSKAVSRSASPAA